MPGGPGKPRTRQELNTRIAEAKSQGGAVIEGFRKECLALKAFLEGEAKKLSNPLLKSTKAHIEKMADWGDKNWKALAQDSFRSGKKDGDQVKKLADVVDVQLQKFKSIHNK